MSLIREEVVRSPHDYNLKSSAMGMDRFTIGIIGMGAMGAMYAERLSDAGWK